jgi:hypothetical protein
MFEDKKEKYREFREWQKVPHHVKPMSEDEHVCPTCGRHYVGNYCPQCGQSSKIGRYSLKNALLLYLDVWGLGNRGMFRTIRDLFLRPGYMIQDYLRGMQMAYFPPFKMLFLLATLSLLVSSGLNIKGENQFETEHERLEKESKDAALERSQQKENTAKAVNGDTADKKAQQEKDTQDSDNRVILIMNEWERSHGALMNLALLIPITLLLYPFFRHCPNIPDMRLSEFFVAMVYMGNLQTMFEIIFTFFCIGDAFALAIMFVPIIPLKQFSGSGYLKCIFMYTLALLLSIILIIILIVGYIIIKNDLSTL